jgi:hypothetical protein
MDDILPGTLRPRYLWHANRALDIGNDILLDALRHLSLLFSSSQLQMWDTYHRTIEINARRRLRTVCEDHQPILRLLIRTPHILLHPQQSILLRSGILGVVVTLRTDLVRTAQDPPPMIDIPIEEIARVAIAPPIGIIAERGVRRRGIGIAVDRSVRPPSMKAIAHQTGVTADIGDRRHDIHIAVGLSVHPLFVKAIPLRVSDMVQGHLFRPLALSKTNTMNLIE